MFWWEIVNCQISHWVGKLELGIVSPSANWETTYHINCHTKKQSIARVCNINLAHPCNYAIVISPQNIFSTADILLKYNVVCFPLLSILSFTCLNECMPHICIFVTALSKMPLNMLWIVYFCCFTSQVNCYGHGGTVSSPNHSFSWASLS